MYRADLMLDELRWNLVVSMYVSSLVSLWYMHAVDVGGYKANCPSPAGVKINECLPARLASTQVVFLVPVYLERESVEMWEMVTGKNMDLDS